ncbi:MAG: efflux RND transporter periplasmic adaptor subunit [Oleispira antarctica]|nr:efflux RND transporter periplasmic adaptor subunit [Oleispira antarctica]MBQ0791828.1 efflux RND transporter periplasmic adaptor subunit [Oleispira antarctica]
MNSFSFNIKLIALLCISAGAIYLLTNNKPIPEKSEIKVSIPVVPYTVARSAEVSIPIFSRGKVSPAQTRHITSEVPGLVTLVSDQLINGGLIQQDELLIQLDQQPFILDIAQKQSTLDQAKLHFYETKAKARVAKKGAGSNASDYALFVPQLRYANSQVDAASAALNYAKNQLEKASIKAPITGKVIMAKIHPGEYLQTTQELAKIYGTETVEVRLPLNDQQISLLALEENLENVNKDIRPTVLIQNFQDNSITWYGTITRTEGERDKNQLLYVIASVNNNDNSNTATKPLLPGSFIQATITGHRQKDLHILPRESLQAEDKLWAISTEDRLSRRAVEVIYRGKEHIYITSGIKLGERIVTGSFSNLVDGLLVEPKPRHRTNKDNELESPAIVEAL